MLFSEYYFQQKLKIVHSESIGDLLSLFLKTVDGQYQKKQQNKERQSS